MTTHFGHFAGTGASSGRMFSGCGRRRQQKTAISSGRGKLWGRRSLHVQDTLHGGESQTMIGWCWWRRNAANFTLERRVTHRRWSWLVDLSLKTWIQNPSQFRLWIRGGCVVETRNGKNKQESKEKTSKEANMARKKSGRKTSRKADKTRTSSCRIGASEEAKVGERGREGRKEGSTVPPPMEA